jgi:LPS sulfotransferase NodH
MSNNDNLSTILENEISNIFDNILNYADSPDDLPRNNEDYLHEQSITDVHTLQLNTLNNFINQYFSQINMFQENARDMLQMIRTTIHQQNVVYSHVLRRNNMRQNVQTQPVFSRTNARNRTNTNTTWNVPQYEYTYEILIRKCVLIFLRYMTFIIQDN